jgi:hypothetical protein
MFFKGTTFFIVSVEMRICVRVVSRVLLARNVCFMVQVARHVECDTHVKPRADEERGASTMQCLQEDAPRTPRPRILEYG